MTNPTIGVFDSGFGGLTVLRALLPLLPNANYVYLGDTARLPYGSKSQETIARYAVSSARFLHEQGAELLVVACNTATALAIEDIRHALPIPVIGVIEPGAKAAQQSKPSFQESSSPKPLLQESSFPEPLLRRPSFRPKRSEVEKSASLPQPIDPPQNGSPQAAHLLTELENRVPHLRDGLIVAKVGEPPRHSTPNHVLVLATAATVQSHAYTHALNALGLEACEKACPLLVPLVEEGWIDHPVTDEVLRIYLTEAFAEAPAADTLLLGCTHYPLLEPAILRTLSALNHPLTIIDSAQATAQAVATHLASNFSKHSELARNDADGIALLGRDKRPEAKNCLFYATDSIEKFQRLGSNFLGQAVTGVRHIDLSE
jgi:glutamate racemase